jgi:hypothetical protein
MIAPPRLTVGPVRRALLALALGGFGIGTGEFVTLSGAARRWRSCSPG